MRGSATFLLTLALAAPLAAQPDGAGDDYVAAIDAWHAGRIERLLAPTGWLSLVGLHWLEPGRHRIGRAVDNDVVLNTGPEHLGWIALEDGQVRFVPQAGLDVRIDGAPAPAQGQVLRVEGGEGPSVVAFDAGEASFIVIRRGERLALRVRDARAPTRVGFAGIERFPVDPRWRVVARFVPHPPGKTLDIATVLNTVEPMANPGALEFELEGRRFRLEAILEAPTDTSYFVIFADRTNRDETYAAGRFVYTDGLPVDGQVVLDFNKAYNPPCALNAYSTCPLPPPENRMDLAVRAGEKRYRGPH